MVKTTKLCQVHSFSMSPNLCQHSTHYHVKRRCFKLYKKLLYFFCLLSHDCVCYVHVHVLLHYVLCRKWDVCLEVSSSSNLQFSSLYSTSQWYSWQGYCIVLYDTFMLNWHGTMHKNDNSKIVHFLTTPSPHPIIMLYSKSYQLSLLKKDNFYVM